MVFDRRRHKPVRPQTHDPEYGIALPAAHLKPGGHIIVLSPAFKWLYSSFDKAIGHYRRYTPADARRLTVAELPLQHIFFLDSVGLFASLANWFLLRAPAPSPSQIRVWDRAMVPASVYTDRIFGSLFGRTIVMIWQKASSGRVGAYTCLAGMKFRCSLSRRRANCFARRAVYATWRRLTGIRRVFWPTPASVDRRGSRSARAEAVFDCRWSCLPVIAPRQTWHRLLLACSSQERFRCAGYQALIEGTGQCRSRCRYMRLRKKKKGLVQLSPSTWLH